MNNPVSTKADGKQSKSIKCLVWDLDNTLWHGTLIEDDNVILRDNVLDIIKTLDERGILQSIASKNEDHLAMAKLQELGLQDYFLYPQINWGSKASSVETIASSINIGLDSIAFIDDQPFERAEVSFSLPQVLCIDAAELDTLLDRPEMKPRFITKDSKLRRGMYLNDIVRNQAEEEFAGPKQEFLTSLNMVMDIFPATADDLQRAEELTVRTHQLNATGYTYSYDELKHFSQSDQHQLLMARLEDRYGSYGHIGLTLVECQPEIWTIKLLLMSCRVMSRGVGSIMLSYIMNLAQANHVRLQAEFVPTDRNRMMNITYRFGGFREVEQRGNLVIFEHDLADISPYPDYVQLQMVTKAELSV